MAMQFDLLKGFIRQGPLTIQVTGSCMDTAIPIGAEVRLEYLSRYYPGDIIACKRGHEEIVSHRFLGYARGRGEWRVVTRADNTGRADAPASIQNVLGRVTHVNGAPYQPRLMVRIRAFVDCTFAVLGWVVSRLVVSLGREAAR